jgi:hypothetical protein
MNKPISRRILLKAIAAAAGKLGLGMLTSCGPSVGSADDGLDPRMYLPLVRSEPPPTSTPTRTPTQTPTATSTSTNTPTATNAPTDTPTATNTPTNTPTATYTPQSSPSPSPSGARVVHIHSEEATFWDFGDDYYGDYVDQDVVNAMVDRGVIELTGVTSIAQAWRTLVPNYAPGKAIAVKVNLNNCFWCGSTSTRIDALVHPINSIIGGLLQAYPSFQTNDMWIYEASTYNIDHSRQIPHRFKDGCRYPGVRFFDRGCSEKAGYVSAESSASVTWHNPPDIPTPPPTKVTDVLVNASYVINLPILKAHGGTAVTLSFKNHFGSIDDPLSLHDWVMGAYRGDATYHLLADIYRNPHILGKTVLTIGDGLFGNWADNLSKPAPWSIFGGGAPNSLLFASDPVALDSVMCDILYTERVSAGNWEKRVADDYLEYAAGVGLGTYERGDPSSAGYEEIEYIKVDL